MFFFLFYFLNISWEAKGSLIVNSGSLSPLSPNLYFFKTPPWNCWALVLPLSPNTHLHIRYRPLHQSGCFQGWPAAVIHNYPLRPSPGLLGEAMEKSYYIIIWLDCCRRQCQGTHLCAPEVAPNNQHLWPCGFNRKGATGLELCCIVAKQSHLLQRMYSWIFSGRFNFWVVLLPVWGEFRPFTPVVEEMSWLYSKSWRHSSCSNSICTSFSQLVDN